MATPEYAINDLVLMRLVKVVKSYKSQNEAARAIGISPELLSMYLRGRCFPRKPMLAKIDRVYLRIVAYENYNPVP